MNENQSIQNVNNKPEKTKKKFSEKSFGGKILTILKWGIIGYFSLVVLLVIIALIIPTPENKEVSSTKDTEKVEVSDEKETIETPEPEDTSQEEVDEEEPVIEEPEEEPIETYASRYPNHHTMGYPYSYSLDDSSIEFTIESWGYNYDNIYINFHVKNTGNTRVTFGAGNFRFYADNKAVEMSYGYEDAFVSEVVDSGRELVGRVYGNIAFNQFSVLEVEMGDTDVPFILYDKELEAIAEEYERANYTDYVNINANDVEYYFMGFMEVDEVPMEEIAGHYIDKGEGKDLIQYIDISMYSEPDEDGQVGTAGFVYNGSEWNVPFWYMGKNYYSGGSITVPGVDFAISTIPGFDGEPANYYIRIFIDGKDAGQLKMEYPFIS